MALSVSKYTYPYLPSSYKHTFLIRHPLRSIYSYRKGMFAQQQLAGLLKGEAANERTYDLERDDRYFLPGYYVKEIYDLWVYVKENLDSNPVVIDGDDLLTKPKETLSAYCSAVGLPYSDNLLKWDASTDVIRKMKAPGDDLLINMLDLYGKAMRSSEFMPQSEMPSRDQLTPDVIRCADKVTKYYEEMYDTKVTI